MEDKEIIYTPNTGFCTRALSLRLLNLLGQTTGSLFVQIPRTAPAQMATPSDKRLREITINKLVQSRLGPSYLARSLRESLVTVAVLNRQSHKAPKNQIKHKTNAMMERYTPVRRRGCLQCGAGIGLVRWIFSIPLGALQISYFGTRNAAT